MLALRNSNVIKRAACRMGSHAVAVRASSQEAPPLDERPSSSWEKEKLQMELQNAQKQREHDLCMKKMESCMPLKIKKVWPEFAMKVFLIETLFRVLTGHF